MIDFGALPPEINSGRMYAGAGPQSLVTASSAWNALANELNQAATGVSDLVSELSEDWQGPASTAMATAAAPYAAWLSHSATEAEHTANQASAAAAAFENAFASMVPPPVIAENRAILAEATDFNIFGQYTNVIAQLEAQYAEMWAQDSKAMFTFAAQSAQATKVTPFTAAPTVADPPATATQGAAVASAAADPPGTVQSTLAQLISSLPGRLRALAAPAADPSPAAIQIIPGLSIPTLPSELIPDFLQLLTGNSNFSGIGPLVNNIIVPFASLFYNLEGLAYFTLGMDNMAIQEAKTLGLLGGNPPAAAKAATGAGTPTVVNVGGGGHGGYGGGYGGLGGALGGPDIAIRLGAGGHMGGLSVPDQWPGALSPALGPRPIGGSPVSEVMSAPESNANLVGGVPVGGIGAAGRAGGGTGPRYGIKPTVMARPPVG